MKQNSKPLSQNNELKDALTLRLADWFIGLNYPLYLLNSLIYYNENNDRIHIRGTEILIKVMATQLDRFLGFYSNQRVPVQIHVNP